jgi:phosphoglycolate phosphatase-like HAD superfamily hydrolase
MKGHRKWSLLRCFAVLFDIDETLVHTGGSGARSWAWAFKQCTVRRPTSVSTPRPVRRAIRTGTAPATLGEVPSFLSTELSTLHESLVQTAPDD